MTCPSNDDSEGSLPLPECGERWSLFLDFDGTLAEIVARPDEVCIAPELPDLLGRLSQALGGAVALVSGRPIAGLDELLGRPDLSAAGLHGLELRLPGVDGGEHRELRARPSPALAGVKAALQRFAGRDPRLLLEDKGGTLALHYRGAPERAEACERVMRAEARALPDHEVMPGKMVLELKPRSASKAAAAGALMAHPPFDGGRPVFVGDDVTDEDGFAYVLARGGIAIKVGPGGTRAGNRAPDVGAVIRWLERLIGAAACRP